MTKSINDLEAYVRRAARHSKEVKDGNWMRETLREERYINERPPPRRSIRGE